jgi:hypothetical protein
MSRSKRGRKPTAESGGAPPYRKAGGQVHGLETVAVAPGNALPSPNSFGAYIPERNRGGATAEAGARPRSRLASKSLKSRSPVVPASVSERICLLRVAA